MNTCYENNRNAIQANTERLVKVETEVTNLKETVTNFDKKLDTILGYEVSISD